MDKGYYDYDYTEPEEKPDVEIRKKSEKEVSAVLARFGFKTKLHRSKSDKPTDEEVQAAGREFLGISN